MIELLQNILNGIFSLINSAFLELNTTFKLIDIAGEYISAFSNSLIYLPNIVAGTASLIIAIKVLFLILGR